MKTFILGSRLHRIASLLKITLAVVVEDMNWLQGLATLVATTWRFVKSELICRCISGSLKKALHHLIVLIILWHVSQRTKCCSWDRMSRRKNHLTLALRRTTVHVALVQEESALQVSRISYPIKRLLNWMQTVRRCLMERRLGVLPLNVSLLKHDI